MIQTAIRQSRDPTHTIPALFWLSGIQAQRQAHNYRKSATAYERNHPSIDDFRDFNTGIAHPGNTFFPIPLILAAISNTVRTTVETVERDTKFHKK